MSSDFMVQFVSAYRALSEKALELQEAYRAATAKPSTDTKALLASKATDPQVIKFHEYEAARNADIVAIRAAIAEARSTIVGHLTGDYPAVNGPEDIAAIKDEFLATKRKVTKLGDALLSMTDGDATAYAALIEGIPVVNSLGGGSGSKSTGDIVRLRIAGAAVDGRHVEDKNGKTNLTMVAAACGVDGAALRASLELQNGLTSLRDAAKGSTLTAIIGEHNVLIDVAEAKAGKVEPVESDEDEDESDEIEDDEIDEVPASK